MNCPRDGSPLVNTKAEGEVVVDSCVTCGGLWLDQGELEELTRLYRERGERVPPEQDAMTAGLEAARQKNLPPGPCPKCGETMVQEEYGYASMILVDRCTHAHGVWLDKGELEEIEAFYARERAESSVPVLVEWLRNTWLTRD